MKQYFNHNSLSPFSKTFSSESDSDVGISILNFNGSEDTVTCVKSIIENIRVPSVVGILENGSEATSKAKLQDRLSSLGNLTSERNLPGPLCDQTIRTYTTENSDVNLVVVDSEKNLGFCTGNNLLVELFDLLGLPHSLVLNNDTRVREGMITQLLNEPTLSTTVAVSPVIYDNDGDIWYCGGEYFDWEYEYAKRFDAVDIDDPDDPIESDPYITHLYSGCCVLFDTDVYRELGGMHDPNFIAIDEPEFSRRLESNGYTIQVAPSAELDHDVHQTLGQNANRYAEYFYIRNLLHYSQLHNGTATHLSNILRQFLKYFGKLLDNIGNDATGRTGNGFTAVSDYFRGHFGPGVWWDDLNSLHHEHPLWNPHSNWNP